MSILKKYIDLGFSICPFDVAANKPMIQWEALKTKPLTIEQAAKVFTKSENCGVVAFCGDISGGLRCIDIELHSDLSSNLWSDLSERIQACDMGLWDGLIIEQSKRGGYHLFYKILGIGIGNNSLAKRFETKEETDNFNITAKTKAAYFTRKKLLIEELGEGHPVTITPTKNYKSIKGDLQDIAFITKQQHELLLAICKDFDQIPEPQIIPETKSKLQFTANFGERKAWVEYNEQTNILDVMIALGWKKVRQMGNEKIYISKPERGGKDVDASILVGKNTVHFWAANCGWECGKGFSPFDIYKTLECAGDNASAVLKLRAAGYGDPLVIGSNNHGQLLKDARLQISESINAKLSIIDPLQNQSVQVRPSALELLKPFKFDYAAPIIRENTILNFYINGNEYRIGGRGKIVVATGKKKSGKTTLAAAIAASALANKSIINTHLNAQGKVYWFDTEQPFDDFQETQHIIYKTAGHYKNANNYEAFSLINFSKPERLMVIDEMINKSENLDVVFIDGIRDLIGDYNNLADVELLMDKLNHWASSKNILIILNLHLSKSTNNTRGFLGTELDNKAVAIIESARDDDGGFFNVICRDIRYQPFPNFQFFRDESGCPCLEQPEKVDWSALKNQYGNPTINSNIASDDCPF